MQACDFPDSDFLSSLVDLYFTNSNPFWPLLHRPTFEEAIANGLHQRDTQFAATVFLVCAIGVRFSQDSRAIALPYDHIFAPSWTWFLRSQEMYQPVSHEASLYTIQAYGVSVISQHVFEIANVWIFPAICHLSGCLFVRRCSLDSARCRNTAGTRSGGSYKAEVWRKADGRE